MTRKSTYLLVRLVAFAVLITAATVLPRGVPAALLVVAAGVVAVVSSLWANAGASGERAGARPQDRYWASVMPPQGDWPPYEDVIRDAAPDEATLRPPAAS